MKKLLSLLSALTLGATTSLSVIACGDTEPTPNPENPDSEYIKQWSSQTSNIAKSFILSKNENFNTNRVLNNALNNNKHNIKYENNEYAGSSYESFKNVWGYNNEIEGITEADFNSNSAATIDNDQIATKNQIKETLEQIQTPLSLVATLLPAEKVNNKDLKELLSSVKGLISPVLWTLSSTLKENSEIIDTIKSLVPMIEELVGNIDAFNPEKVLGADYNKDDIAKSLFGKNGNDGWLNHYQTSTEFSSEAVAKNSSILKEENFKTWDQVALFKSSIDLNGFIYQLSGKTLTLGEIFDKAIKYDGTRKVTDFDINEFINQIKAIWTTTPENIINLISTLIPIVKYQLLGINPTQAITKITTKEPTNIEKGILNLTNIIEKIEDIILTKDGFTNFITDIFFPKAEKQEEYNLSNYVTFDFTIGDKPLSEVILPIKPKIIENLGNFYATIIEPTMKKVYVQDIANKIKEILNNLEEEALFEINLSEIQKILEIVNNVWPFIEQLTSYQSEDEISDDWMNLWATLGLQDSDSEDFTENSVFAKFAEIMKENDQFLLNLVKMVSAANTIVQESIDVLVTKETTANIDFNNENLWAVDETTIKWIYNEDLDETTISYNLINKTKAEQPITYKVTIIISGNGDEELGINTRQVWLKSLNKAE